MELENKLKAVKNELNKALEENVVLKEEITALSEVGLKTDHEKLQKEVKTQLAAGVVTKLFFMLGLYFLEFFKILF